MSNNPINDSRAYLTPLRSISTSGGAVKHALKCTEDSFNGFGEAYFSYVELGAVKGWKKHHQMTCNLVVPVGSVKFVVRYAESDFDQFIIGEDNYSRLTIPPGVWFAFKGLTDRDSIVLNVSDIVHDPNESEKCELASINFQWRDL